MATAIYIGLMMNVKSIEADEKSTSFLGNLFFCFATYDILVLIALFSIG